MEAEGRRSVHGAQEPRTSPAAGGGEGAWPQKTRKRRSWTAEEDAVLAAHVRAHGAENWDQVPKITGLARPGRSCRWRWLNNLQPGLKHGVAFSRDEELHLCRLHAALGNKWSRIAAEMEGRSENEVMTYWFSYVRRCQRAGLNVYPPEVQAAAGHSDLHQPQRKRYKSQTTSSLSQQPPPPPYLVPVSYLNHPMTMVIAPPAPPPPVLNEALPTGQFWASLLAQSNQIVEQGMQPQPPALPMENATEFNQEGQPWTSLLPLSNQNVEQGRQPQPPALPMEFNEKGQLSMPLPPLSNQNVEQERRLQSPALRLENETELNEKGQPWTSLPPLSDQNVEQGMQPQPPALSSTEFYYDDFFGANAIC